MTRVVSLLAAFLVATVTGSAADPAVWPQWRGPTRDGTVAGQRFPDKLGGGALRQLWRVTDLGPSYSGPVVGSDRVFTTQTLDKKTEVVTAHDRKTGKELWKTQWDGSITVPFFAAKNGSWIRATPAYDGGVLYVAGIRDLLVAIRGEDGKELWRVDFVKEFGSPAPDFGFASSPLVDDTGVYVQAGGCFAKLEKTTGKVLWRALKDGGGMMGSAFSSPVFAELAGKAQAVVQTRTRLAGVDRTTGKEIWTKDIPSFRGMNILTPVVCGEDGVLTSTYGGNTRLVKLGGKGDAFSADDAWSLRYEGNMSTPVVVKGHAYILGKDRRLLCVDVKTGKEAWRTDERFGEYWSMATDGEKILALDNRGILFLVKANPKEFDPLDQRKVADAETWAHVAVCGNEIFVRDSGGLAAWKWGE